MIFKILFILMIFFSNCFGQNLEILESDLTLSIDSYDIIPNSYKEGSSKTFKLDSVCVDLFDFGIIKDYIDSAENNCLKRLKQRDDLCLKNIEKIQEENKKFVNSLKLKITDLIKEKEDISIAFKNKEKLHLSTVSKYRWVIGISTVSFVTTIILLSVN